MIRIHSSIEILISYRNVICTVVGNRLIIIIIILFIVGWHMWIVISWWLIIRIWIIIWRIILICWWIS